MAMSVSRQPSAAFVAGNDAPPIGERAATRERSEIIPAGFADRVGV
jgi:hypothetical protein